MLDSTHKIRHMEVLFVLLVFTLERSVCNAFSYVYDVLKPQFYRDFQNSCSKYPFVQSHYDRLKNPTGQIVTFVFQQPGLKNGGFGDRIAGLIHAAGLAARYNRSLIIRSSNEFERLFRPYIPPEHENAEKDIFTYNRTNLIWAKYDQKYENNDNTELDLYFCINISGKQSTTCSMLGSNPPQPLILLRGNRAYMCAWWINQGSSAHQELVKIMGAGNDNLFEAAGCLMRLSMWPTDLLWKLVDEAFESHKLDLLRRGLIKHHEKSIQWRHLISAHFRCGDFGYIHGALYDLACQHSTKYNTTVGNRTEEVYNIAPHTETPYMVYGTPIQVAECAEKILTNLSARYELSGEKNKIRRVQGLSEKTRNIDFNTVVHIASDNDGSAHQINETIHWPNTMISPKGCHLELDTSFQCLSLTATYFLLMSLSDTIISPGSNHIPNSGYSRYAAVYGLKPNSVRDPKDCDNLMTFRDMSHIQHNNWFC